MRKVLLLLGLLLALAGCAVQAAGTRSQSSEPWRLGFGAPANMEVWVEEASALDVRGRLFGNLAPGTVAISYAADPSGWPERPGPGKGRDVTGADLPARIYVRWQSLVEPQTYEATLEIPERMRTLMRQREPMPLYLPAQKLVSRNHVVVGLAPGGIVKMWNSGSGLQAVEVMCVQATVVKSGPYGGKSGGKHRPLTERAAPYVENNPIPFDSWKCDR